MAKKDKSKAQGRWIGLLLIFVALLVYYIRPGQNCGFLGILCWFSGANIMSFIFTLVAIVIAIIGLVKLIKG